MYIHHHITIGIVAGELSGDILGGELIKTLKKHLPNVYFFGIAGPNMKARGMESWYDMEELTTMGIIETIIHLPKILKIRKNLIKRFLTLKPDIFIGIDLPDFNIKLEQYLKNQGIYTIHYVSPSIWAWRKKRIFKIANATNNILVFFPFEKKIYDNYNIPCQLIGHALADLIPLYPNKYSARNQLGISKHALCLVLLPGSRKNEVKRLINYFINCIKLINLNFPNIEILLPIAHTNLNKYFKNIFLKNNKIHILKNQSQLAMIAADIALVASGTATLECMLAKCPMVVAYRINPLTFILIKYFIKIKWISLPNLLAERELVQEFIQRKCTSKNLAKALLSLLMNSNQQLILKNIFLELHKKIKCNANEQAFNSIMKLIKKSINNRMLNNTIYKK